MKHYDKIHDVNSGSGKQFKHSNQEQSHRSTTEEDRTFFDTETDYQHYPIAGIYIIETGRCKILQRDANGNTKTVSVIGRNDSFGGSEKLKIAVSISRCSSVKNAQVTVSCGYDAKLEICFLQTLDYLGEIVAGGEIDSVERDVSCLYLTIDDIKRIPEFDLKNFRETIFSQNLPFMQIGARKSKIDIEEMQNY